MRSAHARTQKTGNDSTLPPRRQHALASHHWLPAHTTGRCVCHRDDVVQMDNVGVVLLILAIREGGRCFPRPEGSLYYQSPSAASVKLHNVRILQFCAAMNTFILCCFYQCIITATPAGLRRRLGVRCAYHLRVRRGRGDD